MALIDRTNPLNLQYRTCLLPHASHPLGVILSKSLLKANALVLGLDKQPQNTTLNARPGTHFQFLEIDVAAPEAPDAVLEAVEVKFKGQPVEGVDVLVNLFDEAGGGTEWAARLSEKAVEVMRGKGKGVIINVVAPSEEARVANEAVSLPPFFPPSSPASLLTGRIDQIELTKTLASKYQNSGIRCNIVIPSPSPAEDSQTTTSSSHNGTETEDQKALYAEAREHMAPLIRTEKSVPLPLTLHPLSSPRGLVFHCTNIAG